MAIPDWSAIETLAPYIKPDELLPPVDKDLMQSATIGPVNLNDSKNRLDNRYWLVSYDDGTIYVQGSINGEWGTATVLFLEPIAIEQISLTFDQLGRPLVFYRVGESDLKLFWYNPVIGANEISLVATGTEPNAGFDVPEDAGASYSDALLFYVREDKIFMRTQRDRFVTEYETPVNGVDIVAENVRIESVGARIDNRFQVSYLQSPWEGFEPPAFIPPEPLEINHRYYYRLASTVICFYLETPLITDPKENDIRFDFDLLECTGLKRSGLAFPIYCEGEATVPYPITATYNSNNNGVIRQEQLHTSRRFSLSFMYNLAKKLQLVLVINSSINIFVMPFDFDDARWSVIIEGNDISILKDGVQVFSDVIERGINNETDIVYHAKIAAFNMQPSSYNWIDNFTGIMSDININIDETELFYPINNNTSALQESRPDGNDIVIQSYRSANWIYKQY
jgi:hypothetical protein